MASGFYSTTDTSLWPRDPYPPARQVWVYVGVCARACMRARAQAFGGGEGGLTEINVEAEQVAQQGCGKQAQKDE